MLLLLAILYYSSISPLDIGVSKIKETEEVEVFWLSFESQ